MAKKFILILILIGVLAVFVNEGMLGYQTPVIRELTCVYGQIISRHQTIRIIRYGSLDKAGHKDNELALLARGDYKVVSWNHISENQERNQLRILAVTPDAYGFKRLTEDVITQDIRVLVESSGIDAWHATSGGVKVLENPEKGWWRVVIFDGGHHLPTVALAPDLIIVPSTTGYAAHGYMRDAVSIKKLCQVLDRENIDVPVVSIPRWQLVKTPQSMGTAAARALSMFPAGRKPVFSGRIIGKRTTARHAAAFVYITGSDWKKSLLSLSDVKRIYLSANFNQVDRHQVAQVSKTLRLKGIRVETVNEPNNVADILAGRIWSALQGFGTGVKIH
ncbi:MAG: hypothetical protein ACM3MK_07665 [Chitinophagales bacterium]